MSSARRNGRDDGGGSGLFCCCIGVLCCGGSGLLRLCRRCRLWGVGGSWRFHSCSCTSLTVDWTHFFVAAHAAVLPVSPWGGGGRSGVGVRAGSVALVVQQWHIGCCCHCCCCCWRACGPSGLQVWQQRHQPVTAWVVLEYTQRWLHESASLLLVTADRGRSCGYHVWPRRVHDHAASVLVCCAGLGARAAPCLPVEGWSWCHVTAAACHTLHCQGIGQQRKYLHRGCVCCTRVCFVSMLMQLSSHNNSGTCCWLGLLSCSAAHHGCIAPPACCHCSQWNRVCHPSGRCDPEGVQSSVAAGCEWCGELSWPPFSTYIEQLLVCVIVRVQGCVLLFSLQQGTWFPGFRLALPLCWLAFVPQRFVSHRVSGCVDVLECPSCLVGGVPQQKWFDVAVTVGSSGSARAVLAGEDVCSQSGLQRCLRKTAMVFSRGMLLTWTLVTSFCVDMAGHVVDDSCRGNSSFRSQALSTP